MLGSLRSRVNPQGRCNRFNGQDQGANNAADDENRHVGRGGHRRAEIFAISRWPLTEVAFEIFAFAAGGICRETVLDRLRRRSPAVLARARLSVMDMFEFRRSVLGARLRIHFFCFFMLLFWPSPTKVPLK